MKPRSLTLPGLFHHSITTRSLAPRNAAIWNQRGVTCFRLKDYDGAIRDQTRALQLKPDFADAYAQRGLARLQQGREQEAQQDFVQCLTLKPRLRQSLEQLIAEAREQRAARAAKQ